MKYRKKPVVVEAFQMTFENRTSKECWPQWMHHAWDKSVIFPEFPREVEPCLMVATLEGALRCNLNDWIIRGVEGELYLCEPDIFKDTYESVTTSSG